MAIKARGNWFDWMIGNGMPGVNTEGMDVRMPKTDVEGSDVKMPAIEVASSDIDMPKLKGMPKLELLEGLEKNNGCLGIFFGNGVEK